MATRGHLTHLSATAAAERIAAGKLTSVELVEACLERIAERENEVHAWAFVDRDLALAQARARDGERPRGPLHGVPVGIKDVIDTEDMPTEYGSKLYAGHRPKMDAATVARLRAQGAVILGKTRTTEFACPFPTITRNPHDLTRTPGVSSSGSAAAVADFMVPLANGTQTGGSVIRPASLCGLYGYKGSLDHLDRAGIRHLKPSIDTLGLFARALEDIVLMRSALVNGAKPKLKKPRKLRIGVARTHVWPQAQPETVAMIEQVQRILGAADVALPMGIELSMKQFPMITRYEGLRTTDDVVMQHLDDINSWSREGIVAGQTVTRADYEAAVREAQAARALIARTFDDYDVLITPAATGEAPADLQLIEGGAFNGLWTHLYVPCVTIPCFVGPNGMPVGLQIVAAHGADEALLAAAGLIEGRLKEAAGKLPIRVP
jgi:Asp-tRNA(Asn)/Glu-tRNA(Gln) amidotransferase A subunit family amidase